MSTEEFAEQFRPPPNDDPRNSRIFVGTPDGDIAVIETTDDE